MGAYGKQTGGRFGLHPRCKECRQAAERERYQANREQILAQQKASPIRREWRVQHERKRRYGVSREQFEGMLAQQQGRCAICREEAPLGVDHDHLTGEVRGLLCLPCNLGIGQLRDDPCRLLAAVAYLREPPGVPS